MKMWPCGVAQDSSGRQLTENGKLKIQSARPELKNNNGEDKNRTVEFQKRSGQQAPPGRYYV